MSYVFLIELGELNAAQVHELHALGCGIQIPAAGLDDEQFARLLWLLKRQAPLNLERPETFNEKLQWLKLRHRPAGLPALVDKLAVRRFVEARVGPDVLNTLYASADSLHDIPLESLPDAFIIKCTHGSGWNIVVSDRGAADWPAITARVDQWLATNYYDLQREWIYRSIPPRVVVERLIEAPSPPGLIDYKFFCFAGRAHLVQVDLDRATSHRRHFYDREWQRVPCELRYPNTGATIAPPQCLSRMIETAEALATGFPFVRVDLFDDRGAVRFGELTFYPGNGLQPFTPADYDRQLGDLLRLPAPEIGQSRDEVPTAWR